jgi:hypothetical protein
MSKYSELISKARKPGNQKTSKPDDKTRKPENQVSGGQEGEEMVNLSIKVPLSQRRHWAAEAKKRGKTMTEVMIHALEREFGSP